MLPPNYELYTLQLTRVKDIAKNSVLDAVRIP